MILPPTCEERAHSSLVNLATMNFPQFIPPASIFVASTNLVCMEATFCHGWGGLAIGFPRWILPLDLQTDSHKLARRGFKFLDGAELGKKAREAVSIEAGLPKSPLRPGLKLTRLLRAPGRFGRAGDRRVRSSRGGLRRSTAGLLPGTRARCPE